MVEIQHGCTRVHGKVNTYNYSEHKLGADKLLDVDYYLYEFVTAEGEYPEIGDFISGGKLVKRTEPKVNNDWSRWKDKDL